MKRFLALMYHNLSHETTVHKGDVYTVRFKDFQAQLDWLNDNGFIIEGFDGLEKRISTDDWPERYLVLTFDDGFKSALEAVEALHKINARATFFVTKQFCETNPGYVTQDEIIKITEWCDIGSHSVTHPYLVRLPEHRIRQELTDSKAWLEDLTGKTVRAFSFPHGSTNTKVNNLAFSAGYTLLGNSVEWFNSSSQLSSRLIINRIAIRSSFTHHTFSRIMKFDMLFLISRMARSFMLSIPKSLLSPDSFHKIRGSLLRGSRT